jgi:hypothetical protein
MKYKRQAFTRWNTRITAPSIANYQLFWPLIDNVYSIRQSRDVAAIKSRGRPAHKCHYVICRFKRARDSAPSSSQVASTTKRAIKSCDVTFQLLEFSDHVEFHSISQHSLIHDHSLDESDANKRNSLLRGLAGNDVAKSYAPAAIVSSLRGTRNISA